MTWWWWLRGGRSRYSAFDAQVTVTAEVAQTHKIIRLDRSYVEWIELERGVLSCSRTKIKNVQGPVHNAPAVLRPPFRFSGSHRSAFIRSRLYLITQGHGSGGKDKGRITALTPNHEDRPTRTGQTLPPPGSFPISSRRVHERRPRF